jgi:hypothetical protein
MNPHLKALLDAGKTPEEIAALCGVSSRTVKGWIYGRRVNASAEMLLIREFAHQEACRRERERPRTARENQLTNKCGCGGLCDSKEPCPMAYNA